MILYCVIIIIAKVFSRWKLIICFEFWIHLFSNQVSRVSRRLGINPDDIGNSNRRQGVQTSFVAKGISGMMGVAKSIPVDMVMQLVFIENNYSALTCLDMDEQSHNLVGKMILIICS